MAQGVGCDRLRSLWPLRFLVGNPVEFGSPGILHTKYTTTCMYIYIHTHAMCVNLYIYLYRLIIYRYIYIGVWFKICAVSLSGPLSCPYPSDFSRARAFSG